MYHTMYSHTCVVQLGYHEEAVNIKLNTSYSNALYYTILIWEIWLSNQLALITTDGQAAIAIHSALYIK